jgi:hypothetical protein
MVQRVCIILTQEEGIVFKIAYNQIKQEEKPPVLKSLNPNYDPYEVPATDIREVWSFCNYISAEIPEEYWAKDRVC